MDHAVVIVETGITNIVMGSVKLVIQSVFNARYLVNVQFAIPPLIIES